MKTTIYDLLGMIKDGKAPKKILYDDMIWRFDDGDNYYWSDGTWLDDYCDITKILNDEVEILETTITYNPTGNKIEKLEILNSELGEYVKNKEHNNCYISKSDKVIINKINEIIDKLNGE